MGAVDEAKSEQATDWLAKLNAGKPFGKALTEALDRADKWRSGAWEPVPVPLEEWGALMSGDAAKPGLFPGLHVVAAGTSIGKTALATSIATMAAKAGGLVAYFALELSAGQVALRMASELPSFGHWAKVAKGRDGEREHHERVAEELTRAGVWICEPEPSVPLPIFEWAQALRGLSDARGVKVAPLLVLDYTQLLGLGAAESDARQRISAAAADLRRAARECDVVVLAISSVSRANYKLMGIAGWVEAKCDEKGNVGDPHSLLVGKESGEIEFFADSQTTIISVERLERQTTSALVVAKNREGTLGWAPGLFREGRWQTLSRGDVVDAAKLAIDSATQRNGTAKATKPPTMSEGEVSGFLARDAEKKGTGAGKLSKKSAAGQLSKKKGEP